MLSRRGGVVPAPVRIITSSAAEGFEVVEWPEPTTYRELHGRLLRDTFGRDISDADAFLLFTAFHYHQVELSRPQVYAEEKRPDIYYRVLAGPLPPRQCAEALASVWAGELDVRAEPSHWLCRWQDDWGGYVRVRWLSASEVARLYKLVGLLERHPFVARFIPDGSQPFTRQGEPGAAADGGGKT